jgi:excisionase family DNA binding protein
MSDRLLTAAEVAERLSVPESWVRQESRENRMPHVRLGRYVRFDWPAVVEWLEEQRAGQWRKHRPTVRPERVARSETAARAATCGRSPRCSSTPAGGG